VGRVAGKAAATSLKATEGEEGLVDSGVGVAAVLNGDGVDGRSGCGTENEEEGGEESGLHDCYRICWGFIVEYMTEDDEM
jgi:hypothetical protein